MVRTKSRVKAGNVGFVLQLGDLLDRDIALRFAIAAEGLA
jgi:hypothetical protein